MKASKSPKNIYGSNVRLTRMCYVPEQSEFERGALAIVHAKFLRRSKGVNGWGTQACAGNRGGALGSSVEV